MNATQTQGIKSGQVLRYTLLPEFLPRILSLFTTGFRTLAFYIASIFGAVRIFPRNHPYLQAGNFQQFGLISVLAEGSRSVTWDRKHIDQILIYLSILAAFVTLLVQFVVLGTTLITTTAFAGDFITDADNFDFFFTPLSDSSGISRMSSRPSTCVYGLVSLESRLCLYSSTY